MNPSTADYLNEYIRLLNAVKKPDDIYASILTWQWNNRGLLKAVIADLNASLGLKGEGLLKEHLPTTAVGNLSGIVVIAANPGWSEPKNTIENNFRSDTSNGDQASPLHNRNFSEDFFNVYPSSIGGTIAWWTKVLKLSALVAQDDKAKDLRGRKLWEYSQQQYWRPGCIDLVPFHSSRDHITARLQNPPAGSAAESLRRVAMATLQMALRIQPKLLLVTSKAGAQLISSLSCDSADKKINSILRPINAEAETGMPWNLLEYYEAANGAKVMAFPMQVFSGRFYSPDGFTVKEFASRIRSRIGEFTATANG